LWVERAADLAIDLRVILYRRELNRRRAVFGRAGSTGPMLPMSKLEACAAPGIDFLQIHDGCERVESSKTWYARAILCGPRDPSSVSSAAASPNIDGRAMDTLRALRS